MKGVCKATFAAAACLSSPEAARAEIIVSESEYRAGVLVVRGETSQSSQRVTIDGRFEEWTNKSKEFTFRIRYLPHDCLVTLRAGSEVRAVSVTNCTASGDRPPVPPLDSKNE